MAESSKLGTDTAKKPPPNAGKGRPKGSLNKTTKAAKDAIAQAAEELGGVDRLVEWVKEDPLNERVFWGTVYPKLLPLQVSGDSESPLTIQIVKFGESRGDDPASA